MDISTRPAHVGTKPAHGTLLSQRHNTTRKVTITVRATDPAIVQLTCGHSVSGGPGRGLVACGAEASAVRTIEYRYSTRVLAECPRHTNPA